MLISTFSCVSLCWIRSWNKYLMKTVWGMVKLLCQNEHSPIKHWFLHCDHTTFDIWHFGRVPCFSCSRAQLSSEKDWKQRKWWDGIHPKVRDVPTSTSESHLWTQRFSFISVPTSYHRHESDIFSSIPHRESEYVSQTVLFGVPVLLAFLFLVIIQSLTDPCMITFLLSWKTSGVHNPTKWFQSYFW